jgi:arabinose-5-phosphate isomerase
VLLQGKPLLDLKIKDVMNTHAFTIYSDEMAVKAASIMEVRKKPLTVLPVIDRKKKAVGMIHVHDLILHGLVQEPT